MRVLTMSLARLLLMLRLIGLVEHVPMRGASGNYYREEPPLSVKGSHRTCAPPSDGMRTRIKTSSLVAATVRASERQKEVTWISHSCEDESIRSRR